jgi:16S rRNA A1518/A1519 N6-dimethyltransferase RsmA/KsgA/DIM1 with predicted DNA glycosylase/AP lyase activity
VLEVGPGTGNLTIRILEKCKKLQVIEMDPRMAAELSKRVQGKSEQKKLEIVIGDFCKMPLSYFDVVISNTPYQVSPSQAERRISLILGKKKIFRSLRHWFSSCCLIDRNFDVRY